MPVPGPPGWQSVLFQALPDKPINVELAEYCNLQHVQLHLWQGWQIVPPSRGASSYQKMASCASFTSSYLTWYSTLRLEYFSRTLAFGLSPMSFVEPQSIEFFTVCFVYMHGCLLIKYSLFNFFAACT